MLDKRGFNIKDSGNAFLAGWLTMFGLQLAAALMLGLLSGDSILTSKAVIIANQIAFFTASVIYCKKRNINLVKETGLKKIPDIRQMLLLIPISVFAIGAFLPLATWFIEILYALGYPSNSTGISEVFSSTPFAILCLCVFPAIGEEIFIRGTVMPGLKNRSYAFAIIASAALFSIMHGSALQTVHQFGLGLVLAYVVIVTGDIKMGMFLHFLNNFLSIISDIIFPEINQITFSLWQIPVGIVEVIFSMVMLFVCLKIFTNVSKNKIKKQAIAGDAEVIDIYPEGRLKYEKNVFSSAVSDLFSIFKKGGLKMNLAALNGELAVLAPLDEPEDIIPLSERPEAESEQNATFTDIREKAVRDKKIPASLLLAYIAVILVWLVETALSFAGLA